MHQPRTDPKSPRAADLTPQYLRAIELRAEPKATELSVATALGIDRRTLLAWRRDPLYRLIEGKYLDEVMAQARAELRNSVLKAVQVLQEAMDCEEDAGTWKVRVQAAEAVLDRVGIKADSIREGVGLTDEELDEVAKRIGWGTAGAKH